MLDQLLSTTKFRPMLCASLSVLLASCGGGSNMGSAGSDPAPANQLAATIQSSIVDTLALNKPTTSSSAEGSALAAAAAVDGNLSSRWGSQFSDAQWIKVDLGAATTVNHVVL